MTHRFLASTRGLAAKGPSPGAWRRACGFTLLELLVVLAILGVFASVAWPAYASHVARAKRAAARAVLLEAAQFMERHYATQNTYALGSSTLPERLQASPAGAGSQTGQAHYTLSVQGREGTGSPDGLGYRLVATPVVADARCGELTLEHTGKRGRSQGELTDEECWR